MIKKLRVPTSINIFLGQGVSGIFSLTSIVLTARFCGPDVFGYVSISLLVFGVLQDLVDFGGASWASRELASGRISSNEFQSIRNRKLQLCIVFFFFIPLVFVTLPVKSITVAFVICLYPVLWLTTNYIQQFFISLGKFKVSIFLQITERLLWNLVVVFHFLHLNIYMVFVLPIIIGLAFHVVVGELLIFRQIGKAEECKYTQKDLLREAKHFGSMSVLSDANNLDSLIMASALTIGESAKYSIASRFRNPLTLVFQSIATHIRPVAASKSKERIVSALREDKFIFFSGIALDVTAAVLMLFYGELILGSAYAGVSYILVIVTLSAIPIGVSAIATSFLVATGSERVVSLVFLLFVPLNLSSLYFSSIRYGAVGGALSILIITIITMFIFLKLSFSKFKNL